jgi:hypothetical protein
MPSRRLLPTAALTLPRRPPWGLVALGAVLAALAAALVIQAVSPIAGGVAAFALLGLALALGVLWPLT